MNKLQKLLIVVTALSLILMFGCSLFQNAITPCYIEEDAAIYAAEPLTELLPYTSLLDAERIDSKVDYKHQLNQVDLNRLMEDDDMKYDFLKDRSTIHITAAKEFKQTMFSPEGPVGLLLPTLFGGVLGGLLIKRPQEKELERKLNV